MKRTNSNLFIIGLTPIYSYLAGKINTIKLKQVNTEIQRNKSVGTIDSIKHFGAVRSPLAGRIIEINKDLFQNPKSINDSPFGKGWIAKIITTDDYTKVDHLKTIDNGKDDLISQIKKYNVKCFKAFPDFQLVEIGTECSATLAKLDEFMGNSMQEGQIIRLVSDDPTADLELMRWAERNEQEIVEIIREKNNVSVEKSGNDLLFNIIIKKMRS